ncbi:Homeobox protein goosecoid [Bagarius yarrelli]|uniref:Homeobox protein goosecoid n=1 Tax=Bagarius yarrelli TaxID=175774 RepID=A0A556U782_BAGYA|nr:Homeobox protein goosecoid [Bagarius yarrelli]
MDASKFSNFTIDYILGERTSPQHQTNFSSASQNFQEDLSAVNLPSASAFSPHSSGVPVMAFPASCPGIYDAAACYNTFHCCGPVTCYQTSFNMSYRGGEHWLHAQPDYDREEGYHSPQHRQRNRIRTVFTESQVKQLDQLFNITDYPTAEARAQLARNTGLSEETVRVWFKNRRARRKRQKTPNDSPEP